MRYVIGLALVVSLAGCSGGGDSAESESKTPPVAAGDLDKNQAAASGWSKEQVDTMQKYHSKEAIAAENAAEGGGATKSGK
jgi:PBP1b-binding outer membrane lipoprotein LpoB